MTENASGDDGRSNIVHSQFVTRNGQVFRVDTYTDGHTSGVPVTSPYTMPESSSGNTVSTGGGGGTGSGPSWAQQQANAQQQAALAEQQRQFNERLGMDRARGDQQQQLSEATQKWREATDSRDFGAAEFWKSRAYELQRNAQTMDYTKQLQSMSGPQDYVKYWYASRGMTTPKGSESVPYEQAIPAWAQPRAYGSEGGTTGNAARPGEGTGGGGNDDSGGNAALPAWYNSLKQIGTTGYYGANGNTSAPKAVGWGAMTIPGADGRTQGVTVADAGAQAATWATANAPAIAAANVTDEQRKRGPVAIGPGGIPMWGR